MRASAGQRGKGRKSWEAEDGKGQRQRKGVLKNAFDSTAPRPDVLFPPRATVPAPLTGVSLGIQSVCPPEDALSPSSPVLHTAHIMRCIKYLLVFVRLGLHFLHLKTIKNTNGGARSIFLSPRVCVLMVELTA